MKVRDKMTSLNEEHTISCATEKLQFIDERNSEENRITEENICIFHNGFHNGFHDAMDNDAAVEETADGTD